MSSTKRWAGLAVAMSLALSGAALVAPLATASPAAKPMLATTYASQAKLAADWLATQKVSGGDAADTAIALAAEGSRTTEAKALVQALAAEVAADPANAYATSSYGAAAKTAIAALTVGLDPHSFGGVDLFTYVAQESGTYPFSDALASIAYQRAGMAVPAALQDRLTAQATFDMVVQYNDMDSAGLVLSALAAFDDPASTAAKRRLEGWLAQAQVDGAYWPGYSPVNSTALVGMGYLDNGLDVTKVQSWLSSQQQTSGAFPNTVGGTASNLMATHQALILLSNSSYLSATAPAAPAPTPTPTPAPTTPTPPPLNERVVCADNGGVWTVIQVEADVIHRGCVTNPATAYAAFATLATVETKDTSYGPMICSVDHLQDCNAAFSGTYWGFYTSGPNLPWGYASEGATTFVPAAGSYVALIWSEKSLPNQVLAGDGAVPAPVATPSPSPAPATTTPPKLANTGSR